MSENEGGIFGFGKVKLKTAQTPTSVKTAQGNQRKIVTREPLPTVQPPAYSGPPQVVLIISKHWIVYEWISEIPLVKKILFTTTDSYNKLQQSEEAKKEYTQVLHFESLTSGMVEYFAEKLHQQYKFTHVVALAEEDLIRAGRIRKSLGISHGQNVENALRYRDKVIMKSVLKEAGIRVPEFCGVESASDILDFVKKHGNQVVVKPRKGYSSVNTWIIKGDQDLQRLLSSNFNTQGGYDSALDLEIEKFVDGKMHHIDGLVYDNEVKVCWASKYINICADFNNTKFLASYTLHPSNPLAKRFQTFTVDCIKALGGPSCFPFHAEAWITPQDDIVFCEIGSRTGGAWVRHVMWRQFEIMQDKTFTQWQCQIPITHPELGDNWEAREPVTTELSGWIFIYPQVGKLAKVPSNCPLSTVVEFQIFGAVGDIFKSRANCVDSVCSVLFRGKTEDEMEENAKNIYEWFHQNTVYENI